MRRVVRLCALLYSTQGHGLTWGHKRFSPSAAPGRDLKHTDVTTCRSVLSVWYQQVVDQPKAVKNAYTLRNLNRFETITHLTKQDLTYLVWMPCEIQTNLTEDILAVVVGKKHHEVPNFMVRSVVCNPAYVWGEHIPLYELKRALHAAEGELDLADFAAQPESQRLILEWSISA